ncbi:MAG: bacillithiol biosynthesis BshC, partial [Bacteroidota bacterium]
MSKLGLWDKFPPGYLPNWLEDSAWNSKATGLYPHEGSSTQWEDVLKQLKDFSPDYRAILVSVIEQQSQGALSEIQAQSLQLLAQNNTFTVTAGQQIHFDLGPSYVFYKIVSAISLAQELAQKFPDSN